MPGSLCTTKSLFVGNSRSCVVEPAFLVKVLSFLSVNDFVGRGATPPQTGGERIGTNFEYGEHDARE
jgi:hypothetical protein